MKKLEIIGYKRANLGKAAAKKLRDESMVPCVVYGGGEQIHFYSPMILFRELVYTAEAHFVKLNIEGLELDAILQDIQFHPVSEVIMHVDFLQWFAGTSLKMDIPCHFVGQSPGVNQGGALIKKRRTLKVSALPKNMPEHIDINIDELDFGKSIKVRDIIPEGFEILDTPQASIAVVEMPRALRSAQDEDALEGELAEGEEGAEGEATEGGDKPAESSESGDS